MSKKKTKNKQPAASQIQISLSDADINRLANAMAAALLEAEKQKAEQMTTTQTTEAPPRKGTAGDILRVFFWPMSKLKPQNSALSLVKIITSTVCWFFSKMGYLIAIAVLLKGGYEFGKAPSIVSFLAALFQLLSAATIWLLSRLVAATGLEIEQSKNENLIFGVSAFILAVIAIVVSM